MTGRKKNDGLISNHSDCKESKLAECSNCYGDFIPQYPEQELCPKCIKNYRYIDRLKALDFQNYDYIEFDIQDLDYIDIQETFENLFRNCLDVYEGRIRQNSKDAFQYILLYFETDPRPIVITYLPERIIGDAIINRRCTMTELRQKKNHGTIIMNLDCGLTTLKNTAKTIDGEITFFHYPMRLSVQLKFNKQYGEATDFYIIGIQEDDIVDYDNYNSMR